MYVAKDRVNTHALCSALCCSDRVRMMHTTNDSVVMAITKNIEHIISQDPDSAMDVFSFMRPISDENVRNMYSNLQSASIYLKKTQQMAKIIPSPVSYAILWRVLVIFFFFFFSCQRRSTRHA